MDFFSHQDAARRSSRRLTILFALAVIAVVAAVNVVMLLATRSSAPGMIAVVTAVTLAVIFGGTLFQMAALRDGGSAVCEMMDGRRLTGATTDIDEKRLLNVVEEMALASGVSVPLVYVMDHEDAMNAFAAGYSPNDAAVAVTRGLLRQLDRDELQGVIAHEFSHILNGDMRLNIRMIGLLFGIEMIGHCGRVVMRGSRHSDDARGAAAGVAIGLGLFVVGFVGMFAADVIRAAIGRQREYLADASAVQFTRLPDGLGNALVKIAAASGVVEHRNTDTVSHMFLAGAMSSRIDGLLATHPPIQDRIDRVLGAAGRVRMRDLERKAKLAERIDAAAMSENFGRKAGRAQDALSNPAMTAAMVAGAAVGTSIGRSVDQVVATIGNPGVKHVEYAHLLIERLPHEIREALNTPDGAKAVILALITPEAGANTDVRGVLKDDVDVQVIDQARWVGGSLASLDARLKLPVAALAFPALRALPPPERDRFVQSIRAIVSADNKVTPFEFALTAMLRQQLGSHRRARGDDRVVGIATVRGDVATVLSLFVRAASQGSVLFAKMAASVGVPGVQLLAPSAVTLTAVEVALARLVHLAAADKERMIRVCLEAVLADEAVSARESELMRAVCAILDTPLPPIIDQTVATSMSAGTE